MNGFCEECGTALGAGAKFCAACGTRVRDEPSAAQSLEGPSETVTGSGQPPNVEAAGDPKPKSRKRWLTVVVVLLILGGAAVAAVILLTNNKPEQLNVKGTFTISNGSYDPTDSFSEPNYHGDGLGGCEGTSGYDDLNSITQVVVKDNHGNEVTRTQLGEGMSQGSNHMKSGSCDFTFHFTVTQGPQYFVVSVGDRGSEQYTYDELRAPDAISLVIGQT